MRSIAQTVVLILRHAWQHSRDGRGTCREGRQQRLITTGNSKEALRIMQVPIPKIVQFHNLPGGRGIFLAVLRVVHLHEHLVRSGLERKHLAQQCRLVRFFHLPAYHVQKTQTDICVGCIDVSIYLDISSSNSPLALQQRQ